MDQALPPLFVRAGQRSYVDYCAEGGRSLGTRLDILRQRSKNARYVMTSRPHPLISRATTRPAGSPIALPLVRQLWISTLSLAYPPCPCPHNSSFSLLSTTCKLLRSPLQTTMRGRYLSAAMPTMNIEICSSL